jgi:putative colanic acid biosynthesis glycosyltransferase
MTDAGTVAAATLVSVVTVVRNDRVGFLATWASLRAQGFRGFEWIVVAGTSSDGTDGAIADAVAAGEVTHHVPGVDGGPYRGMNRGADLATGRFLLFLNAGDRLADADVLDRVAARLAAGGVDLLYGDHVAERDDGTARLVPALSPDSIASRMFTSHQSILYAAWLVRRFGFDPQYAVAADYVLTLHALMGTIRVVGVPYPISLIAPAGISARRALRGRVEQALARRRILRHSLVRVACIFLLQTAAWRLRGVAPRLYERMRRHRRMQRSPWV